MLELNQDVGTSLVVVTHNMELAGKIGTVMAIENGTLGFIS